MSSVAWTVQKPMQGTACGSFGYVPHRIWMCRIGTGTMSRGRSLKWEKA